MSLFRLAAVMSLLLAAAGGPARAANPATPGQVPASWSAYAAQVGQRLQAALADQQDPTVTRLHQFLDAQAAKDPQATPPAPIVRLWFSRTGQIDRATFHSLGDAQADRDLRSVLSAHPIGLAPPRSMRQPLIIRLRLTYKS